MIYFHTSQFKQADKQLREAAELLRQPGVKSDHRSALQVKIFANLAIVSIALNKFEDALQANEEAIDVALAG